MPRAIVTSWHRYPGFPLTFDIGLPLWRGVRIGFRWTSNADMVRVLGEEGRFPLFDWRLTNRIDEDEGVKFRRLGVYAKVLPAIFDVVVAIDA